MERSPLIGNPPDHGNASDWLEKHSGAGRSAAADDLERLVNGVLWRWRSGDPALSRRK
jgi:hypothetical protein